MTADDFKECDDFTAYEAVWSVRGVDARVHVFLEGGLNKENCPIETIVPNINAILERLSARGELAQVLRRDGMLDRAEEWVFESKPDAKDDDCFIIDGVEVRLPITMEEFADSLRVINIGVTFDGSADNFSAEAFIYCYPDYFAGHAMELVIESDGSMECIGLAG